MTLARKYPRLSVQPVTDEEWKLHLQHGRGEGLADRRTILGRHSGARAERGCPESIITVREYGFRARRYRGVPE